MLKDCYKRVIVDANGNKYESYKTIQYVHETPTSENSSNLQINNNKAIMTINSLELTGGETATTEDIIVTRSGKNLIKYPYYDKAETVNGVTFIYNDDGSVTLKGTATANAYRRINRNLQLDGGRYTLSGGTVGVIVNCFKDNKWFGQSASSGDFSFTIADGVEILNTISVYVNSGTTVDTTIYPQIEKGNIATAYEPHLPPKSLTFSRDYLLSLKGVNNLLDKSKFPATQTINGVTFTNNGDGTITVDGTLIDRNYVQYTLTNDYLTLTHKYLLIGCPSGGSYDTYQLYAYGGSYNDYGVGRIFTYSYEGTYPEIGIRIKNDVTVSNLVFKPQLYDLTAIYGEGNEPTTVEEFLKTYPLSSTDKLTITKNSVKYNDTDITSEVTGLDAFIKSDTNTAIIDTNYAMGSISADVKKLFVSYKKSVYQSDE